MESPGKEESCVYVREETRLACTCAAARACARGCLRGGGPVCVRAHIPEYEEL